MSNETELTAASITTASITENQPLQVQVFEVEKANLQKTRLTTYPLTQPLSENEVVLKVDKFALTANNISYGVAGDSLGYWRFFPTEAASDNQWGRLPVMGFADVIASNNDQVNIGERVWGFMPMASHVKILAGRVNSNGFSDVSPYRKGLAPLYSVFERVSANPFYSVKNEDFDILVRGLFTTSWLVDDFMDENQYFGASQYLITSASSKTSIALAFAIKQRGNMPAVGITSAANRKFVTALGCYDQVISYDEIASLDAKIASIVVDMAGSQSILSNIHHHFAEQLRYSCRIGVTHHDDLVKDELSKSSTLPGVAPTFFFAPTQLKKRMDDWGTNETMKKIGLSLLNYIKFCQSSITIEHTTHSHEIDAIYQRVLSGNSDANTGQIISL
ncbi:DUF2855 family protein [Colwellia sp. Arc7-635]|uniref:DUF2855 family protein n=1 Tax=Colwellia sp. Arc7-635 TaxID=2497879 RepID=UPI000F8598C7|nr:DUF2855 family protein [Colwellia sp. Arc7-635]AZQ84321.1 DUF2855 family protein [Colwellia sp. Arc7-635]